VLRAKIRQDETERVRCGKLLQFEQLIQSVQVPLMTNSANRFSRRSNENLLQLWRGRDGLSDEDIDPLRTELEQRGLSAQMAEIEDQVAGKDIYGDLPPAPQTYLNLSVPALWVREQWLRYKTAEGIAVEGIIESVQRSRSRLGGAARAELCYRYEFKGQQYSGRVVRDFRSDSAKADSLVYDNHVGEKLPILISRESPGISYYPSGIGISDPIALGLQSLLAWAVVIGLARLVLLSLLRSL
jgi:hypothetical protein